MHAPIHQVFLPLAHSQQVLLWEGVVSSEISLSGEENNAIFLLTVVPTVEYPMSHSSLPGADGMDRRTTQQNQPDPSLLVSQLTSSNEAMQHFGKALAGPILYSLQSAGTIPAVSQPHGLAGFPAHVPPSVQAGPAYFSQWFRIQFPGAAAILLCSIQGIRHWCIILGGQPSRRNVPMHLFQLLHL